MHTFWLFFAYPNGAIWGNVWAMPVCGLIAGGFAFLFRDHIGRAVKGWWHRHLGHHDQLEDIKTTLETHADLLDPRTPGGLAAIMADLKDTKAAAESAVAEVRALAKVVAPTPMKRTPKGGERM